GLAPAQVAGAQDQAEHQQPHDHRRQPEETRHPATWTISQSRADRTPAARRPEGRISTIPTPATRPPAGRLLPANTLPVAFLRLHPRFTPIPYGTGLCRAPGNHVSRGVTSPTT